MPSTSNKLFVSVPCDLMSGHVTFGVNSFRPTGEVQEVVHFSAAGTTSGSVIKCAYTEIEQVERVNATVLSKSVGCWGAEMGANEHGVCISYTQLDSCHFESCLSAQDLVRLGLERGSSAENAVDVLSELISHHGLAGQVDDAFPLANVSMLICDRSEAWILEAGGKHLAAVKLKSGVKCLDGGLTIGAKFDKSSSGLKEFALQHQRWSPTDGEFNFAKVFSDSSSTDSVSCCSFQQIIEQGESAPQSMLKVLRHPDYSSSCDGCAVAGSQLSLLPRAIVSSETGARQFLPICVHWFTATPRPDLSFFKPFVFSGDQASGACERTTAAAAGRMAVSSEHPLWIAHRRFTSRLDAGDKKSQSVLATIGELQQKCFEDIDELVHGEPSSLAEDGCGGGKCEQVVSLFEHMVDLEINFYN